jgi:hypothetical protein
MDHGQIYQPFTPHSIAATYTYLSALQSVEKVSALPFSTTAAPCNLSHKSMPVRAEKPLKINLIEATIGFYPG